MMLWSPRIRHFTEPGDFGADFEALVSRFEAEGHNPKKAHLILAEYYVHVAHARAHQCLHVPASERPLRVRQLKKALTDLRGAARIPLLRAHRLVIEGYHAWFGGSSDKARKLFAEAEDLADRETCPWVSYAVARGKAHMLRAEGHEEAALAQARIAAMLAREHGAVHRLRWITEEFGLRVSSPSAFRTLRTEARSPATSAVSSRSRRHLKALLQISRATARELDLKHQARAVTDEIVESLSPDRAMLFFETEPKRPLQLLAGRRRSGEDVTEVETDCRDVVERVRSSGEAWVLPHTEEAPPDASMPPDASVPPDASDPPDSSKPLDASQPPGGTPEGHRTLAVPLLLHDRVVGVVYIDRRQNDEPFTSQDAEFLETLAYQIPVALELTRALKERSELEESLRQSQKMDAIGQLAGGIAHDFNNMLTVVQQSLAVALAQIPPDHAIWPDLDAIRGASERASTVSRQLLTFSRRQAQKPEPYDVNKLVSELEYLLRRVLGDRIVVHVQLAPDAYRVKVDRPYFEQALVNLAFNARDAMPDGGMCTIRTSNASIDSETSERAPALQPGDYACVSMVDSGSGMTPEVRAKIFEPFFTTKQRRGGTGLGLAMVYGFARQHGGHVDVVTRPNEGSTFRLYLPRTLETRESQPASLHPAESKGDGATILLVEDEPLVRRSIERILTRGGYRVLSAASGAEALELAQKNGSGIDLVLSDVLMPGMTGPELARRLSDDMPSPPKVLFVSGYTDGQLISRGLLQEGVELLHKPFLPKDLYERLRGLLAD